MGTPVIELNLYNSVAIDCLEDLIAIDSVSLGSLTQFGA